MSKPNLDNATSDVLTASDNSIGNSGGTTLVITRMQSSSNFDFLRFLSIPAVGWFAHSADIV